MSIGNPAEWSGHKKKGSRGEQMITQNRTRKFDDDKYAIRRPVRVMSAGVRKFEGPE